MAYTYSSIGAVDLASLYIKTGAKNMPTVFLLTDAQVPDECFLVLINDLLASGAVPDLFSDEDVEGIIAGVRKEFPDLALTDTKENCWSWLTLTTSQSYRLRPLINLTSSSPSLSVLVRQQNCFKTELKQLEKDMLLSLSAARKAMAVMDVLKGVDKDIEVSTKR
ncbi:Dynein heavy chain 11, axonemal isoform X2 [Aix galericulata]|nr:Dynein heavy chain 11, axonemal isoform X2 [Aix galericulata]